MGEDLVHICVWLTPMMLTVDEAESVRYRERTLSSGRAALLLAFGAFVSFCIEL